MQGFVPGVGSKKEFLSVPARCFNWSKALYKTV